MRNVTTNHHKHWAWATVALLAGSAFAQEPPLPIPAPPISDQDVVPAVVLPPQPVLPAPEIPPIEPEVEPVGHRGARLQRPIAVPMTSSPVVATTTMPWPTLTMPSASAGPQWRWYGWGAANAAGWGKPATPVDATLNVVPAPTPAATPTSEPTKPPPPTGLIADVKAPEPSWTPPSTNINVTPSTVAPELAPKLTPPSLDLNLQTPKPAPAPSAVPPTFDPWTGIGGPGAKANGPGTETTVAATTWKTVRAASK
jgi:hypothetical protein